MGTLFRVVLYAPDATTAARASSAAFERIAELDGIMSDYNPRSELMQLCAHAGERPVKVSDDLFRVMAAAQDLSRRSDGAFDITVGPAVRLWRRARRRHELPDRERLARALELVGYQKLRLDPVARTAQLLKPGMLLDLGGIAKGDAADQALIVLKRWGIESALVAAAGDITVGAPPLRVPNTNPGAPTEQGWKIAIAPLEAQANTPDESKIENSKPKTHYVFLHDCAISTSGDAEQHLDLAGLRYSHLVNPKTGMALTGRRSVTVVAPKGITADSLATGVSVLGRVRGLALVKATPGTAVLYVEASASGVHSLLWNFPQ
jgi:FAD:protein FMN transferase